MNKYQEGTIFTGYDPKEGVFEFEIVEDKQDGLYLVKMEDGNEEFEMEEVLNGWIKGYEDYLK